MISSILFIRYELNKLGNRVIVLADENMLRSSIYNLIANSIKSIHNKGEIVVSSKIINGVKQILTPTQESALRRVI